MAAKTKSFVTSNEMLSWQYFQILFDLGELQRHDSDPTCPCRLSTDLGENCLAKHSLGLSGVAAETAAMDSRHTDILMYLSAEAKEKHLQIRAAVCHQGEAPEVMNWSRQWRKRLEPIYYACSPKARLRDSIAHLFEPVTVVGKCEPAGCQFKVRKDVPDIEARTASIQQLDKLIRAVGQEQRPAAGAAPAVSDRTFAMGITGITRYEFQFKLVDAAELVVSHDPFTFRPNPEYPQELQPRLRERAATRLQVENIAANLEPGALITDYHSIDRGAPIVGPDNVVESGNGRTMAVVLAAQKHPEVYGRYLYALIAALPAYGLSEGALEEMKVPMLVRLRLTDVPRQQFVQEANASTSIESSAVEKARTDAEKISPEMLTALEVLEGEAIEDALRSPRNKQFISTFLSHLPPNEQARLVDARGILNQDGVRRAAMAIFVATFHGDVGLKLAEKFFESTDINVRNVFMGIVRSLGPLAQMEKLVADSYRLADYSLSGDLARAVSVFSAIKKTPGMTVAKYMAQLQMEERELTPFQERLLVVLDEHSRSARRIALILSRYAQYVIDQPPPDQAAMFPGAPVTKEQLFEMSEKLVAEGALADIARLFEEYPPNEPRPLLIRDDLGGIVPPEFGTHNYALVDPQELARIAVATGASSLLLAHNHPTGDPDPSDEDKKVFEQMKTALKVLSVDVVDMMVVGQDRDYSIRGSHELPAPPATQGGQTESRQPHKLEIVGSTPTPATSGQARMFDYSWLAKKLDPCNLSVRDIDAALGWRPLRELVSTAIGLKKRVALCSIGMVYGHYQLTIYDVSEMKEGSQLAAREKGVPGIRRVYQFNSRDRVYEVTVPADKQELTWEPQEIIRQVRHEPAEQPALFDGEATMSDKGAAIRIVGKCDSSGIGNCVFKVRRVCGTATVTGSKNLAAAIDSASCRKGTIRITAPKGKLKLSDPELEAVGEALEKVEMVNV